VFDQDLFPRVGRDHSRRCSSWITSRVFGDFVTDFEGEKFCVAATDDLPARGAVALQVATQSGDRRVSLGGRRVLSQRDLVWLFRITI